MFPLSELRVPDFLIPHAFLAQCPYCYSSLEDLYFPINVVHYCPSCSMPINEVPPDEEIIYMMGGRPSIKKALFIFGFIQPYNKTDGRIYQAECQLS